MPDKNQFTFEDDDDFPETKPGDQKEVAEPVSNDDDDFPESDPGGRDELTEPMLSFEDEFDDADLSGQEEALNSELVDNDFPEDDLSAAFLDGEHSVETPLSEETEPKVKGGGNPRTRVLLMVLLLIVAVVAGVYYFMGLGGTTPSVPTAPAQTAANAVALPPQSDVASAPAKTEPAATSVSVAVPPPPVETVTMTEPGKQPDVAAGAQTTAETAPATTAAVNVQPLPTGQEAPQMALPVPQAVAVEASAKTGAVVVSTSVEPVKPSAGGLYALDAGSYLLDANRDSLLAKARKLGYEPRVIPIEVSLDMTRLRLGTYGKDEVQTALDFARSIEPSSYSAPAGEGYVIYAGTFLKSGNVDTLSERFLKEGIKVYPEPVQVVRTLSRICFGSFATKEEAAVASREAEKAGLKAVVVKTPK